MNRAIYDRSKPTKNLVTTITGIVTLLIVHCRYLSTNSRAGSGANRICYYYRNCYCWCYRNIQIRRSAINLPRGKGKYVAESLCVQCLPLTSRRRMQD